MMDRLYYDAYGEEKAAEMIANTNSDHIILINGQNLLNFDKPYIYEDNSNLATKYISENYRKEAVYKNYKESITILKRKN